MPLTVFLSSSLRRHIPEYNPATGVQMELESQVTVGELCRRINVPLDAIKIIMVDGRHKEFDSLLTGHERVGLFPAIGGG